MMTRHLAAKGWSPDLLFPSKEVAARFVIAHELGHALVYRYPSVFKKAITDPTDDDGWHPVFGGNAGVGFPLNQFASDNPLYKRNASRGDAFKEESLADILATYIYAPQLLSAQQSYWVTNELPTVLYSPQ